jgi:hypothetical protein
LAGGLIVRELFAPWTGHDWDFEILVRLGLYMQRLQSPYTTLRYVPGLSFAPYSTIGSISYPPFSAFLSAAVYRFYLLLGEPSRYLYYFLLKQPIILTDIGIALIVGRMVIAQSPGSARTAVLIWLYLPVGIIISSIWGQLDPIALFLTLLAVYYLRSAKLFSSALMLGLSIYVKTLPIVFLPVFIMRGAHGLKNKLTYTLVALGIPAIGTLAPALALNWGYQGMYNNFSFQVGIPSLGAMSLLGQVYLTLSLGGTPHSFTGYLWLPILLAGYVYVWKRKIPMVQGLLVSILVFSISRPLLPEQWSLYPLAFLLLSGISKPDIEHFIGIAVSATGFLVAWDTLLVKFFTPVSVDAYYWALTVPGQGLFGAVRAMIALVMALLYFTEALAFLLGRESLVYRMIMAATPTRLLNRTWSLSEVRVR